MKNILYGIVVSAALFLTGCADAGSDQEANIGQTITLDANKSTPSAGGTITSYKWEQTQGPDVILQDQNTSKATFTAPNVTKRTNLAFRLTTTETGGRVSPYHSEDYVVVYVNPNGTEHNDREKPVITLIGEDNVTVQLGGTYEELGATATDNVDGNITKDEITVTGEVDTNTVGTYTITYNVSDAAGNAADTVTRTVNVVDNNDREKPVITLIGEDYVTIYLGDTYTDEGATANDDVDGNITDKITVTGTVDVGTKGTYILTYAVSDEAGNAADIVTRTVHVISGELPPPDDTEKPVITLIGEDNVTVQLGGTYEELGATANDDVDGNITDKITVTGEVDTNTVGTYTVTYAVSDAAGNAAVEVTRTVTIIDGDGIEVVSISNGKGDDYVKHHVVLNKKFTAPKLLSFSLENISTEDNDYDHYVLIPPLSEGGRVETNYRVYNIVKVEKIKEFDLYIRVKKDNDRSDETYKIKLGKKTAIGTIKPIKKPAIK